MKASDKKSLAKPGEVLVQELNGALVAGTDAGDREFGRRLLDWYEVAASEDPRDYAREPEFDLLLEIMRGLLEAELESALLQFRREGLTKTETARFSAQFWGALSLHFEVFLRLPPPGSEPVVREVGGEYVVSLEGEPPTRFQDPLSAARVKSVFSALGPSGWTATWRPACRTKKYAGSAVNWAHPGRACGTGSAR